MGWDREGTCPGHGRVAAEQVDDGQLSSGLWGGGGIHFEGSWGWEKPWKKATPSGTEVGALVWKRSSGWCLTLSLLFFGNTAVMVVVVGALAAVGAGRSNNSADLGIESLRWTERQGSRQGRCGQKDKAGMGSAHLQNVGFPTMQGRCNVTQTHSISAQ